MEIHVPIIEQSGGDGLSRPCTVTGPLTDLWARARTSLLTMNRQRQRRKRGILIKYSAFFVIVGILSPNIEEYWDARTTMQASEP
jgi:hypothetical protein